jgi:hypothetical protein
MTPDQALTAFRREGLSVVEIPGWRTNDRGPATGRPTGPKHGLVNHHTGGDTSNPYAYASNVLFKGYTGLPGPLCHQGLDPDSGTLYMVGTGRTNHAGGGDPKVLAAVVADAVPYDRELKPTKGNLDGRNQKPNDKNMGLTPDDRAFITQTEHDQSIWMWREPEVSAIIAAAAEVGCARAIGANVAQAQAKLIEAVAAFDAKTPDAPICAEPSKHNV